MALSLGASAGASDADAAAVAPHFEEEVDESRHVNRDCEEPRLLNKHELPSKRKRSARAAESKKSVGGQRDEGYPEEARSAYKLFCQSRRSAGGSAKGSEQGEKRNILKELRVEWNALSQEERDSFEASAAEDALRFEQELGVWRQTHDVTEEPERRKQFKRRTRPPGFPEDARSPYKIFCDEWRRLNSGVNEETIPQSGEFASAATWPDEGEIGPGASASSDSRLQHNVVRCGGVRSVETSRRSGHQVCAARAAWCALPPEERANYTTLADEDALRFDREFEAWREAQPCGGLGDAALVVGRKFIGKPKPSRVRVQRPTAVQRRAIKRVDRLPAVRDTNTFDDVLFGAAQVGILERRAELASRALARANEAQQNPLEDGGAETVGGNHSMPTPTSAPRQAWPKSTPADDGAAQASADDLLGDLALVQAEAGGEEEFDEFGEHMGGGDDDMLPEPPIVTWPDPPVATGQPRALGPQLCLDEQGNLVINQASLEQNVDEVIDADDSGPVHEAMDRYKVAYKRTPVCKWTETETQMFYEALQSYGNDLFLVQTFFRNKSAAQIKAKYTREMKSNSEFLEDLLVTKRRKLTKETFEQLHGKIDTSKHYKPPPSPPRGEDDRIPRSSVPGGGGGEGGTAPGAAHGGAPGDVTEEEDFADEAYEQEPEYSAEDESLTTNRLMALFD
eukprot:TRINITY_DN6166_c0_g1_i6.p1 TRINITY_DN6166_c0_g1~~TRINITY_DN6166_c0_g1_i6.p1  ORF type:complete len:681 (+),score=118.91 TRINITY_DN6166_c0_g1_i6:52-2094(+)